MGKQKPRPNDQRQAPSDTFIEISEPGFPTSTIYYEMRPERMSAAQLKAWRKMWNHLLWDKLRRPPESDKQ
jgi:hypothetical protein